MTNTENHQHRDHYDAHHDARETALDAESAVRTAARTGVGRTEAANALAAAVHDQATALYALADAERATRQANRP